MIEFEPELEPKPLPKIPLPQGWSEVVLLALLHVTATCHDVGTAGNNERKKLAGRL